MAVLSPPYALGAAGQVLSARLLRLSLGAAFRPSSTGVQGISGVLAGPPNTMGELSLAGSNLTVQPFRAVIQSLLDAAGGQYLVPNDAAVVFALTAQHASQYRRSLVVVRVDDSQAAGVGSSGVTDRAVLEVIDGALAASSGATVLPAPAGSWVALGEVLNPPVGQAITVTPYNPRTTSRGGILPVIADASTVTGHAGAAPTHDGQYRDHPTNGLQRGASGVWGTPDLNAHLLRLQRNQLHAVANGTWTPIFWDTEIVDTDDMWNINPSTKVYAKRAGWFDIRCGMSLSGLVNSRRIVNIYKNGVGTAIGRGMYMTNVQADIGVEAGGYLNLAVNDYIELNVYQDSGGAQNTAVGGAWATTFLEARWVRP